ncbi:MAG: hypothetical protein HY323_09225 [Betaproteobacteria bacterium]|nr:hypothetical protein [Betaproteobacteria bacterium]
MASRFASGFAEGFTQTSLSVLPYFLQRKSDRERLELEKKALTLREKMAKSQDELLQLQIKQATEKLGAGADLASLLQQGPSQGAMVPGQEARIEAGVVPEREPVSPEQRGAFRQRLIGGISRLDPIAAAKLALEPEPQDAMAIVRQLFGGQGIGLEGPGPEAGSGGRPVPGMPPGGAGMPSGGVTIQPPGPEVGAVGRAVPGPPGPTMTLEPSVSFDKQGQMSVSVKGQRVQLQFRDFDLESPPGSGQMVKFGQWINPVSGQASNPFQMGAAAPGEARRKAAAAASGLGTVAGSPLHTFATEQLLLIDQIPDASTKQQLLEQLQQTVAKSRQPPAVGSPAVEGTAPAGPLDIGAARRQGEVVTQTKIEQEARAREKAQREAGKLSEQDRLAFQVQTNILAQTAFMRRTFSRQEIEQFVGLLNRPKQEAELALRGMFGKGGSERFATFKAAGERLRATAFGEGGKQLTPFEASVVFGYTPTGREAGGAVEFMAKLDGLERFTKLARAVRLKLAKEPAEAITEERFDALLQEEMRKAGLSAIPPGSAPGELQIKSIKPIK